eukprot:3090069-Lingulodinium_polyedra.AAC.1
MNGRWCAGRLVPASSRPRVQEEHSMIREVLFPFAIGTPVMAPGAFHGDEVDGAARSPAPICIPPKVKQRK